MLGHQQGIGKGPQVHVQEILRTRIFIVAFGTQMQSSTASGSASKNCTTFIYNQNCLYAFHNTHNTQRQGNIRALEKSGRGRLSQSKFQGPSP